MKLDEYEQHTLCVDDVIKAGDWLKSKADGWSLVVNIRYNNYTQSTGGMGSQSMNYKKAAQIIYLFNGRFLNQVDIEDVYRSYNKIYRHHRTDIENELFTYSDN